MITPLDIQNKDFTKAMRGYKAEEVDVFLDLITLDLEKLIKENTRLQSELEELRAREEEHRATTGSVSSVMEEAQKLMKDISESAEKRADAIIKNAEMDAELKVRESNDRAQRIVEEHKNIQKRYETFRDNYRTMLEEELARFDRMDQGIFPDFQENKLEDIMEEMGETTGSDDRKTMVLDAE